MSAYDPKAEAEYNALQRELHRIMEAGIREMERREKISMTKTGVPNNNGAAISAGMKRRWARIRAEREARAAAAEAAKTEA